MCLIEDNTFLNNYAYIGGGAINVLSSEVIITGNNFQSNSVGSVSGGGVGGAIAIYNGSINDTRVEITENTFIANEAPGSVVYGSGGAVQLHGLSNALL